MACGGCGISFPELTPQSFSFNSPQGMCVDCNGLGSRVEIDPELVIPDDSLSIDAGGAAIGSIDVTGGGDGRSGAAGVAEATGSGAAFFESANASPALATISSKNPPTTAPLLLRSTGVATLAFDGTEGVTTPTDESPLGSIGSCSTTGGSSVRT